MTQEHEQPMAEGENVAAKEPTRWQKRWQKLAAKTNGWVTPGNMVSVIGLGFSLAGLYQYAQDNKGIGVGLLAFGKFMDYFDGKVARASGTNSDKGEMIDAGCDSVTIAAALGVAAVTEAIPTVPLALLAARNIGTMATTLYAKARGLEIHASRAAKINQFIQWPAIGSFLIASSVEVAAVQQSFEAVGLVGTAVSVPLGTYGTIQGMRNATELPPPPTPPLQEAA